MDNFKKKHMFLFTIYKKIFVFLIRIICYNNYTKKVKEMGAMKFIISGKNIEVTEGIKAAN